MQGTESVPLFGSSDRIALEDMLALEDVLTSDDELALEEVLAERVAGWNDEEATRGQSTGVKQQTISRLTRYAKWCYVRRADGCVGKWQLATDVLKGSVCTGLKNIAQCKNENE